MEEKTAGDMEFVINWDDLYFQICFNFELGVDDRACDVLYYTLLEYIYAQIDGYKDKRLSMQADVDLSNIAGGLVPEDGEDIPYFKSITVKASYFCKEGRFFFSDFMLTRIEG